MPVRLALVLIVPVVQPVVDSVDFDLPDENADLDYNMKISHGMSCPIYEFTSSVNNIYGYYRRRRKFKELSFQKLDVYCKISRNEPNP